MLKKVSSIFLALVLLIATVGISVNKHYCGSHLADISLFIVGGCGCDDGPMEDSCCRDEVEFNQLDEDYSVSEYAVDFESHDVAVLATRYVELFSEVNPQPTEYLHYIPPLLQRDYSTLYQSFLI